MNTDRHQPFHPSAPSLGFTIPRHNPHPTWKGRFIVDVWAEAGRPLDHRELDNTPTLDSSILTAMLYAGGATLNPPSYRGLTMLAVGTGATGPLLSPDAPDPRQRRLNAELARKAFASTTYRDTLGAAVEFPTNVVDFTTTFGPNEAVGPINEMGLVRTLSLNPATRAPVPATFPTYDRTVDLANYDILANYGTDAVISIPLGATFSVTWRITF